jgi:hypothetical protein
MARCAACRHARLGAQRCSWARPACARVFFCAAGAREGGAPAFSRAWLALRAHAVSGCCCFLGGGRQAGGLPPFPYTPPPTSAMPVQGTTTATDAITDELLNRPCCVCRGCMRHVPKWRLHAPPARPGALTHDGSSGQGAIGHIPNKRLPVPHTFGSASGGTGW